MEIQEIAESIARGLEHHGDLSSGGIGNPVTTIIVHEQFSGVTVNVHP